MAEPEFSQCRNPQDGRKSRESVPQGDWGLGGRRRAGPTGRPGGRRSHKAAGRSRGNAGRPRVAGRADPQGDRGARKTTEEPGGGRTCGSPRRQDPQGGRKGDETHKSAGRSRGGQTEGCSPRRQDPRGDWGPRRSKGPRARSETRREPRFEPGATWGSQGALLRAEDSDELAGEPRSGPRARPDPQGARKRSQNPRKGPELGRKARDHARGTSRSKLPARSEKKKRGAGEAAARRPLPG